MVEIHLDRRYPLHQPAVITTHRNAIFEECPKLKYTRLDYGICVLDQFDLK